MASTVVGYVNIPGITGGSIDGRHIHWIAFTSYGWGTGNHPITMAPPALTEFWIVKNMDVTTSVLFTAAASSKVFPNVEVEFMIAKDGAQPKVMLKFLLQSVTIANIRPGSNVDATPLEEVTFSYQKMVQ